MDRVIRSAQYTHPLTVPFSGYAHRATGHLMVALLISPLRQLSTCLPNRGLFYIESMKGERGTSAQRGYGSRWQMARVTYLRSHPLCVMHQQRGRVVLATVVDHITPHRGDMALFWDSQNNWQSLCAPCHDVHKARLERSGVQVGCDVSGVPIDPSHHWK